MSEKIQNFAKKYFALIAMIIILALNFFSSADYKNSTFFNNTIVNSFANNGLFFLVAILIVSLLYELIYGTIKTIKLKKSDNDENYIKKSNRLHAIIICFFCAIFIIMGIFEVANKIRSEEIELPIKSDAVYLDITDLGFNGDDCEIHHNYVNKNPSLLCDYYESYIFVQKGDEAYIVDQYIFELKFDFNAQFLAKAMIPDNETYKEINYNDFDKVYISEYNTGAIAIKDSVIYSIQCKFGHPEDVTFILNAILNNQ